jgi:gamma-glutamyl-gamma-aminobutyrate hydrolase PuuD
MQFKGKTIYIEHGNHQYTMLFVKLGFTVVPDLNKADVVCFTGGADVSPHLYACDAHPTTHSDSWRDAKEERLFLECMRQGKFMVGICRGGQFLNVMCGGSMYQDVQKHCQAHSLTDIHTGENVWVSSTHHQMMKPSESGIIVAVANQSGKREWFEGTIMHRDVSQEDIEVVYYEANKALCFQPHPEFTGEDYEGMFLYFSSLLARFMEKQQ